MHSARGSDRVSQEFYCPIEVKSKFDLKCEFISKNTKHFHMGEETRIAVSETRGAAPVD